ncbi:MAG: periplasmic heavy metal sensor [Verrucomicrobiota bacterium]
MKKLIAPLVFLILVFAVAAAAAFLSRSLCCTMKPSHQDAHDWVHTQLGLTPQQDAGLDVIEKRYHEKRRIFEEGMALGNRELAEAIRSEGKDSGRVHAAIEKIHSNMGELQMLTVGHVFEMREVLSPEQYQKLLDFTADALNNLDHRHGGE